MAQVEDVLGTCSQELLSLLSLRCIGNLAAAGRGCKEVLGSREWQETALLRFEGGEWWGEDELVSVFDDWRPLASPPPSPLVGSGGSLSPMPTETAVFSLEPSSAEPWEHRLKLLRDSVRNLKLGRCKHRVIRASDAAVETLISSSRGMVSGGRDGALRLLDHSTLQPIRQFKGHSAEVWASELWDDAGLLFSGGADAAVRAWDLDSGEQLSVQTSHCDSVFSFGSIGTGAGRRLVSGSWDGELHVSQWCGGADDEGNGLELLARKKAGTDAIWRIGVDVSGQVFTGSWDGNVKLWAVGGAEFIAKGSAPIHSLSASAVVDLQATGPGVATVLTRASILFRWDSRAPPSTSRQPVLNTHSIQECTRFRHCPGTHFFLTGHENGALRGWDARKANKPLLVVEEDIPGTRQNGFGGRMSKAVLAIWFRSLYKIVAGRFNGEIVPVILDAAAGAGGGGDEGS